jgi:hypothetical protein
MSLLMLPFKCIRNRGRPKVDRCKGCHTPFILDLEEKPLLESETKPKTRYCDECQAYLCREKKENEGAMRYIFGYTYKD